MCIHQSDKTVNTLDLAVVSNDVFQVPLPSSYAALIKENSPIFCAVEHKRKPRRYRATVPCNDVQARGQVLAIRYRFYLAHQ